MPPLKSRSISRRQLHCTPTRRDTVRIRNLGRLQLLRNDVPVGEADFEEGDTLTLEGAAAFLIERRPRLFPTAQHYPFADASFAFGAPDAHGIIGESAAAWRIREHLAAAAHSDCHVLLLGESGVGKELAVRALHALSPRRSGPLVARNAATFPETLLDAELFGTAKHFPNAGTPERPGLVGEANGGALYLDEIGDLPRAQQAHLLRVLDGQGEYQRLGESRTRHSDFRVYAATNQPISALKSDFLARFGARVEIPSLNLRRADIPLIARQLVQELTSANATDDSETVRMAPNLLCGLVRHEYSAHVRELARLLRIALRARTGPWLALPASLLDELVLPTTAPEEISEERLRDALASASGNKLEAARLLGLSNRFALYRLIKRFGIAEDG